MSERKNLQERIEGTIKSAGYARHMLHAFEREAECLQQELLELDAEVINVGEPEPDPRFHEPARYFLGADGRVWYRTLLDGWRYRGECYYGTQWERMDESVFPLKQLVGTQLKARGL